ncbi:MAG: LAGLIDADG family homing endonuclease [Candidatus Micrarchaeota archaeon]
MDGNVRINHELRINAFDKLNELKKTGLSRNETVDNINAEFHIPKGTLNDWYSGVSNPYGRRGELKDTPELFYVLGALLGDGCPYYWKKGHRHLINISGEKDFTKKFTIKLSICSRNKVKNYINRRRNVWFVNIGNLQLYFLFRQIRGDIGLLSNLIAKGSHYKNSLEFIEGFFDAEGCVKIIKEKARKTPKICLDICCTNYKYLELIRTLLNDQLGITARYSTQAAFLGKDGFVRKKAYHLRIYKKEFVRRFFENISTTKLKGEKSDAVKNWLNNGR